MKSITPALLVTPLSILSLTGCVESHMSCTNNENVQYVSEQITSGIETAAFFVKGLADVDAKIQSSLDDFDEISTNAKGMRTCQTQLTIGVGSKQETFPITYWVMNSNDPNLTHEIEIDQGDMAKAGWFIGVTVTEQADELKKAAAQKAEEERLAKLRTEAKEHGFDNIQDYEHFARLEKAVSDLNDERSATEKRIDSLTNKINQLEKSYTFYKRDYDQFYEQIDRGSFGVGGKHLKVNKVTFGESTGPFGDKDREIRMNVTNISDVILSSANFEGSLYLNGEKEPAVVTDGGFGFTGKPFFAYFGKNGVKPGKTADITISIDTFKKSTWDSPNVRNANKAVVFMRLLDLTDGGSNRINERATHPAHKAKSVLASLESAKSDLETTQSDLNNINNRLKSLSNELSELKKTNDLS
jgi:archaellum component FlaC